MLRCKGTEEGRWNTKGLGLGDLGMWVNGRRKKDFGRKMPSCFGDPEFEVMLGLLER